MTSRDTKLGEHQRFFTPKTLAEYFVTSYGSVVGNEYKTHGDLWGAPDSRRVIGLLELILHELRSQRRDDEWMHKHRWWLQIYHEHDTKLIADCVLHIKRIRKMVGVPVESTDMHIHTSPSGLARAYREGRHAQEIRELKSQLERLKSVKKPEHIVCLRGIGKAKAAKILRKVEAKDE